MTGFWWRRVLVVAFLSVLLATAACAEMEPRQAEKLCQEAVWQETEASPAGYRPSEEEST